MEETGPRLKPENSSEQASEFVLRNAGDRRSQSSDGDREERRLRLGVLTSGKEKVVLSYKVS